MRANGHIERRVLEDERTSYTVRWREHNRRRTRTFTSEAEANAVLREVRLATAAQLTLQQWRHAQGRAPLPQLRQREPWTDPPAPAGSVDSVAATLTVATFASGTYIPALRRNTLRRGRLRVTTRRKYLLHVAHMSMRLRKIPIASVTPADITAELLRFDESSTSAGSRRSPASTLTYRGSLSAFFAEAILHSVMGVNPVHGSSSPRRQPAARIDAGPVTAPGSAITPDALPSLQLVNLIAEDLGERYCADYRVLTYLLTGTGVRISEALAITPARVGLNTFTIEIADQLQAHGRAWSETGDVYERVPVKTRRSQRIVGIPQWLVPYLEPLVTDPERDQHLPLWRTSRKRGSGLLTTRNFQARFAVSVEAAIRQALDAGLDIPAFTPTPHTLRHVFATQLFAAGHPATEVADALGDSDIGMVAQVYRHFTRDAALRILSAADTFELGG